jgi:hypothetical protein
MQKLALSITAFSIFQLFYRVYEINQINQIKQKEQSIMALANEAEKAFQRFNGGDRGLIGTFWNVRQMSLFQQASEGALPKDGIWLLVDNSGTQTFANVATTINTALGTSYTSGSFHARVSGDAAYEPGTSVSDQ